MRELLILIAALACGILGLSRPALVASAVYALWVLVPTIAVAGLFHLPSGIHPAALIAITSALTRIAFSRLGSDGGRGRSALLLLPAILVVVEFENVANAVGRISGTFINDLVGPISLMYLVVSGARQDTNIVPRIRMAFLSLAILESGLALAEYSPLAAGNREILPFATYLRGYYWFDALFRPLGTMDHPLVLGLFLASAVPLTTGLQARWLRMPLAILFLLGTFASGSRAPMVAALACAAWVLWTNASGFILRLVVIAAGGVAAEFVFGSLVGKSALSRLSDVNGGDLSTVDRLNGYRYFESHWLEHFVSGGGIGSAANLRASGILASTLENPVMIYVFEIGAIATATLVSVQLWLIFSRFRESRFRGVTLAAIACFLTSLTFDSVTTPTASGATLWLLIGVAYASREPAPGSLAPYEVAQSPMCSHSDLLGGPEPAIEGDTLANVSPRIR